MFGQAVQYQRSPTSNIDERWTIGGCVLIDPALDLGLRLPQGMRAKDQIILVLALGVFAPNLCPIAAYRFSIRRSKTLSTSSSLSTASSATRAACASLVASPRRLNMESKSKFEVRRLARRVLN